LPPLASPTPENPNGDGFNGISTFGPASVVISGGQVLGGGSTQAIASGGVGVLMRSGELSVTGGTILGASDFFAGAGIRLGVTSGPATISVGTITGGDATSAFGSAGVGLDFLSSTPLTISRGAFSGGLVGVTRAASVIFESAGGPATITGGTFVGPINISGLGGAVTFLGNDLSYSGGILSGTLLDGSPISDRVNALLVSTITVTPTLVRFGILTPEPSSLVMAGTAALVGLACGLRHRGRRAA
jgi:hypothetical protein